MTHIIAEPCVGVKDTACVDVCPVDCIYGMDEDWEMPTSHPEECIDCGLCIDACPVEAIFPEEETPEQWHAFIAKELRALRLRRSLSSVSIEKKQGDEPVGHVPFFYGTTRSRPRPNAPGLVHQMPLGLPTGQVPDGLAVEHRALLELDLHHLSVPTRPPAP